MEMKVSSLKHLLLTENKASFKIKGLFKNSNTGGGGNMTYELSTDNKFVQSGGIDIKSFNQGSVEIIGVIK